MAMRSGSVQARLPLTNKALSPVQDLPAPRPGPRPVFERGHTVDQHVDHALGSEIGSGDCAPFAEGLTVKHG